jgi:hypothetical protein
MAMLLIVSRSLPDTQRQWNTVMHYTLQYKGMIAFLQAAILLRVYYTPD